MKKLFFLLVVVNLVIWLWGQRDRLAHIGQTASPAPGVIRLLDEAEVAARREQAARQAQVPRAPADAEVDRSEPPTLPATSAQAADAEQQPAEPESVEPSPAVAATPQAAPESADAAARPAASAVVVETTPDARAAPVASATGATADVEPPPAPIEAPSPLEPGPSTVETASWSVDLAPVVAEQSPPMDAVVEASPATPLPTAPATPEVGAASAPAPAEVVAEAAMPAVAPPGTEPTAGSAATTAEAAAAGDATPVPSAPAEGSPAQAVEVPEVSYLCESIGPFSDRTAAVRFQSGITAPLRAATVREEHVPRAARHWVLAPAGVGQEGVAALEQAGVRDAWRIPSGPLAGRLAVGVFQSAENARKHVDALAAKGVAAEIHGPKDLDTRRVYWVDYERPGDAAQPDVGAGRKRAARRILSRQCGRVAGSQPLP